MTEVVWGDKWTITIVPTDTRWEISRESIISRMAVAGFKVVSAEPSDWENPDRIAHERVLQTAQNFWSEEE